MSSVRKHQQQPQVQGRLEMTKTETSVSFSPLPPAKELELLEQVQPGITERIVRMAEKEQEHRLIQNREIIELEKKNQRALTFNTRLGLFLGFGSVLVSTGMCAYFAYLGNVDAAAGAAKVVIGSLAAIFITGRIVVGRQSKT